MLEYACFLEISGDMFIHRVNQTLNTFSKYFMKYTYSLIIHIQFILCNINKYNHLNLSWFQN